MNIIKTFVAICAIAAISPGASAQEPWLHIYSTDTLKVQDKNEKGDMVEQYYGIFNSMPMSDVDSIRFTTRSNGTMHRMRLHYRKNGKTTSKLINLSAIRKWVIGQNVPVLRITTIADPTLKEVESKTKYLDAKLSIDGCGIADDYEGDIQIRGRGNSTWNYAKKAYRLKFPEKTKICGFRKARNYVLLANHIDLSLMRNEVANLATQLVGMPYPTHAKPVDVYFNDIYKGSYMLTEKVGINNGSVNLPAADEANSCMVELDVNYDSELQAKSPAFLLPVMHKDPNAPTDPAAAKEWFSGWFSDFCEMESAVQRGQDIDNYIDYTTLAKYLLVFNLCGNQEINHPKSIYLYKTRGGKWNFGPCWDFDWAFGYQPTYQALSDEKITEEEGNRMIAEARAIAEAQLPDGYGFIFYNGEELLWLGGNEFKIYDNGSYVLWPFEVRKPEPTYRNYLLGCYYNFDNNPKDYELGNGGEFFMSIIMDNPKFMAEYERVWKDFQSRLDIFWEEFDAYAKALEPSAERNHTVWEYIYDEPVDSEFRDVTDGTYVGAIKALRSWIEKRLEFMDDPANNYGLYDPKTEYIRGTTIFNKKYN